VDEGGEVGAAPLAAEALVDLAGEAARDGEPDQLLERGQRLRADGVRVRRHLAAHLGDHQIRVPHPQPEPHVVDHRGRVGAEPLRVVGRPLVDQRRGDVELVGAGVRNLHADGADVNRPGRRGIAHRGDATSLRASMISLWMWPFDAVIDGADRSSGPPCTEVTRPPASSIRSAPAATSQAPSRCSQ